jgi:tRNA dimethylallyltransferase
MNLVDATPKQKLIVICGPTGIGKTAAAIAVAETFAGEIINADSMQVYRSMTIGTAKPTAEERARIPHYMVDIVRPEENFDAVRFSIEARKIARELDRRGVLAIVSGGTGLYIKAMLYGLFRSEPPDPSIRQQLRAEAAAVGSEVMHRRLSVVDAEAAARIHVNDTFRIIRALETVVATGQPISEYHRRHGFRDSPFVTLKIGLDMERQRLYERINRRVETMIAAGLVLEVRKLLGEGVGEGTKAMRSLGYRHMAAFLRGRLTWDEAVRTMKRDTRRFAKRQLSWFRTDREIVWCSPDDIEASYPMIEKFLGRDSSYP